MNSFYSEKELATLGLANYGRNVLLSRKASLYSPENISLGSNVRVDDFCILSGSIKIGNYVHIAAYVGLFGGEGILVEDYCGISSRVSIYTVNDDYCGNGLAGPTIPSRYRHPATGPVKLKKHALIGAGSVILPNVTIGTGTVVGALSLVNSDCKPWRIYVGIPAKAKKTRRSDIILKYELELDNRMINVDREI